MFLFQTFKLAHYFPHPLNDERKIYVFPDAPHLIKRFRVHILGKGVHFDFEGKTSFLTKEDFERLLAADGAHGELRRLHKLKYARFFFFLGLIRLCLKENSPGLSRPSDPEREDCRPAPEQIRGEFLHPGE